MKTLFFAIALISSQAAAQLGIQYEVISTVSMNAQPSPIKIKIKSDNVDSLIVYSLNETTARLSFSLKSSGNSSVSKISATGKAHCVGYSRYFASIFSAAINKNGVKGYKISHVRAKIRFLGFNVHQLFDDPAFKDHDVCLIINTKTGEQIFVDPSLSEVLGNVIVKK